MAKGWLLLLPLLLLTGAGGVAWLRCESAPPSVRAPERIALGRTARAVRIELADRGSGLRQFRVEIRQGAIRKPLASYRLGWIRRGPEHERIELSLDARALGLAEGAAELRIEVSDASWSHGLRGNRLERVVPVRIDWQPPRIALAPGPLYVRRGGSGALVYRVSEPTARDGVEVGSLFFPGSPLPGGVARPLDTGAGSLAPVIHVALFAVPVDGDPGQSVRVVATDLAGNQTRLDAPVRIQEREFPEVPIRISRELLTGKIASLARAWQVDSSDLVEVFRRINERRRAQDEARIREMTKQSAPVPLFEGPFLQLPGSKVTSRFAEHRTYYLEGVRISEARHYGYDLAATAGVPVPAANSGRVLFAGELGIYGRAVLVDHGLGLVSLYAHLSRIEVAPGQEVTKGQELGRSGSSGLAAGDHLHFALLLHATYVDPLEWWDPRWVRDHYEARLAEAGRLRSQ